MTFQSFFLLNRKTCQDYRTSVGPVLHVVAGPSPQHHQVDAAQVDHAAKGKNKLHYISAKSPLQYHPNLINLDHTCPMAILCQLSQTWKFLTLSYVTLLTLGLVRMGV